jgi:hypothetical protein
VSSGRSASHAVGRQAGHLDRHEEERAIGPYKNAGSDYRPKGCPEQVKVHDFVDAELGKVVPYGVYDRQCLLCERGHRQRYGTILGQLDPPLARPDGPRELPEHRPMITADGGGSNASRVRLFKVELQKLADDSKVTPSTRSGFFPRPP